MTAKIFEWVKVTSKYALWKAQQPDLLKMERTKPVLGIVKSKDAQNSKIIC